MADELRELAFYYPNPTWLQGDWVKNLILFFDGIALLVPNYMRDRLHQFDPAITAGLEEHGLLTILEPETFIDAKATEALAKALDDILASGALDRLATEPTQFAELSYSRLGYMADSGLAEKIYDKLAKRGLATPSKDGVSIPMHPMVRSLVLVLLAQLLVPVGKEQGLTLHPATDRQDIHTALQELLHWPTMPSAAHVVSLDLEAVGVDLSAVPIDEILEFRAEHRDQYRAYQSNLKRFVREMGQLPVEDRDETMQTRRAEVREAAAQLGRTALQAWKGKLAFSLGLAGAAWQIKSGDVLGGLLAFGAGFAGAQLISGVEAGAYSYLFKARQYLS